jgi:hypothetical protein
MIIYSFREQGGAEGDLEQYMPPNAGAPYSESAVSFGGYIVDGSFD